MAKKKRRRYTRVKPSKALLDRVESLVMAHLLSKGGQDYWTYISGNLHVSMVDPKDPLDAEWLDMSNYGQGKSLGRVMDSLQKRGVVKRKKNFFPYVLTNVLDRIVEELDRVDPEGPPE